MRTIEHLREFLAFNNWANDLILQALKNPLQSNGKAVRIFGHFLLAENEWLLRMTGEHADSTNFDFWAVETLEGCRKACGKIRYITKGFLSI